MIKKMMNIDQTINTIGELLFNKVQYNDCTSIGSIVENDETVIVFVKRTGRKNDAKFWIESDLIKKSNDYIVYTRLFDDLSGIDLY